VKIEISITDVRNLSDQAAYQGQLDFPLSVRITDNHSGGAGLTPATVQEQDYFHNPMHVRIPCAATSDPNIGSTCSVQTSIKGAFGFPVGGSRAMWELNQIAVYDGGPDGAVSSLDDNTPLAVQGVFVP
jgi:hypothetical protein